MKPTCVEHDEVASLPRLSTAVALTVFVPAVDVSIGIVPLGSTFRPDSSLATTVASTPLWPTLAVAGQLISTVGGVLSTTTALEASDHGLTISSSGSIANAGTIVLLRTR